MEHELVLWKLKDYTNHMWIEETILMLMEIKGHLGHGGWRVHPVYKINTGELAIVVQLPPDAPGYYNIRPPRLLLYNMESKICRICSFDFPKFTSGYWLNPACSSPAMKKSDGNFVPYDDFPETCSSPARKKSDRKKVDDLNFKLLENIII
ncbi:hypothetical protein FF1_011273 [Malus domestica]